MTTLVQPADYCEIAAELLDEPPERLAELHGFERAETALAATRVCAGEGEPRLSLTDTGALLIDRLARAHPLPDANRRAAFISLWLFMAANGRPFVGANTETDVPMVERCAAGEATITEIAQWLERRTEVL